MPFKFHSIRIIIIWPVLFFFGRLHLQGCLYLTWHRAHPVQKISPWKFFPKVWLSKKEKEKKITGNWLVLWPSLWITIGTNNRATNKPKNKSFWREWCVYSGSEKLQHIPGKLEGYKCTEMCESPGLFKCSDNAGGAL